MAGTRWLYISSDTHGFRFSLRDGRKSYRGTQPPLHTSLTGQYLLNAYTPLVAHRLTPPNSRPTPLSACPEDRSKHLREFSLQHTACCRWDRLRSSNPRLLMTPTVRCSYSGPLVPASRSLLPTWSKILSKSVLRHVWTHVYIHFILHQSHLCLFSLASLQHGLGQLATWTQVHFTIPPTNTESDTDIQACFIHFTMSFYILSDCEFYRLYGQSTDMTYPSTFAHCSRPIAQLITILILNKARTISATTSGCRISRSHHATAGFPVTRS